MPATLPIRTVGNSRDFGRRCDLGGGLGHGGKQAQEGLLVPESGDDVQALKSGIMEIADIFVVNKSDREGAITFVNNLKIILSQKPETGWKVPVLNTVSITGEGIDALFEQVDLHRKSGRFNEKKSFLLAEKAYRLISRKKMTGIDRAAIRQMIEKEITERGFNLYRFVERFKN